MPEDYLPAAQTSTTSPGTGKRTSECLSALNPNIGSFAANSSGCLEPMLAIGWDGMPYRLIFQKTYDLVKWVYPTVNTFPRKQRLILSQRIEVIAIRILELVIDLSQRDTETIRKKILYEIHKLQILLRLSKDLSYLSFRKYESRMERLKNLHLKGAIEYEKIIESYEGWAAYAQQANSFKLRNKIIARLNSEVALTMPTSQALKISIA